MRFLSSRLRHKAAKPLILVLALFLMGALYAVVAPSQQVSADNGTSQQIDEGKKLFAVSCASCHGLNGEGTSQGPSLVGVGAASVDFQMGTGRMPMAQPGPQAPRTHDKFTDEEISAIAAWVATLGPGPDIPEPDAYTPAGDITPEQIAIGGELFRSNCAACHNYQGSGGALPHGKHAPTLEGVENKHIYEAMRIGPQQMPVFSKATITDEEVTWMIAYLNDLHGSANGGITLGSLGPVSEGFWAWLLGIGGLSMIAVWIASRGSRTK
ncbi:cytochrome bc1 complex diheme cytochrome c subunit [Enemella sp. A6]|uniref:cytochrome bc1 complex diheme cytochrome c subunit n=1 Tax=Enemella sp. A6 TaxID=3440152 RepID=UPI003EBF27A5